MQTTITIDMINKAIASNYNAGKRSLGALRKAVMADLPGAGSNRVSKACQGYFRQQVKAFAGSIVRIGNERMQYSTTSAQGTRLLGVTYGKEASIIETLESAINGVRLAWREAKQEPRNARGVVMRAIYFPLEQGGLPKEPRFADIRAKAEIFLADCVKRNELDKQAKQASQQAQNTRQGKPASKAPAPAKTPAPVVNPALAIVMPAKPASQPIAK